ncbi:MAG: HAD-IB family hydrolase [Candidatus Levybacteria bacterium CG_4_10_14_0_2_um_filter_36_16]|nr:MAG: hypothetical protein AUK12_01670 [Candidatus Levybacteria bacterium CG2_30_37_29]PIR79090.1 MAG: HAD-IB family hydrolase [Candidatus Levybacteria bacterium CG10_big_fil_rev_8_21_14_0_10_36_30]PIZ97098.1 MAG: HAD-IB family hydrolase [Candidatus Levybacteria bacterium CG_4_10_14_0_2_um_filter_36_16]
MNNLSIKKLGIFDIDGTIFRSALFLELVYGLVDDKVFPNKILKDVNKEYTAWANRRGNYMDYVHASWDAFIREIKGKEEKTVNEVIDKFLLKHKDRVYRYTRDIIKDLKKKKYTLIAISGSPTHVVSKFAEYMGFEYFLGSDFETKNGKFTGRILTDGSQNKGDTLIRFIEKKGLRIDLENSIGVGDAGIDISFLNLVGKPIAFNPSSVLAAYAKKNNWKIIVERKDVVYEIKDFKFVSLKS